MNIQDCIRNTAISLDLTALKDNTAQTGRSVQYLQENAEYIAHRIVDKSAIGLEIRSIEYSGLNRKTATTLDTKELRIDIPQTGYCARDLAASVDYSAHRIVDIAAT